MLITKSFLYKLCSHQPMTVSPHNFRDSGLLTSQFQKFSIIHLLVCQIFSIIEQGISCDWCRRCPGIFFFINMDQLQLLFMDSTDKNELSCYLHSFF